MNIFTLIKMNPVPCTEGTYFLPSFTMDCMAVRTVAMLDWTRRRLFLATSESNLEKILERKYGIVPYFHTLQT